MEDPRVHGDGVGGSNDDKACAFQSTHLLVNLNLHLLGRGAITLSSNTSSAVHLLWGLG